MAKRPRLHDPPDSPTSVGWTKPQRLAVARPGHPLELECGAKVAPVEVEYETYGRLNPARDNAILIAHALSGDAHVAGWDATAESTGRKWRLRQPGWWDTVIGPGKAIDTNRFFVVCPNFLGSCYGTTGPSSTDPSTGKAYGQRFPVVTVGDWVRLQAKLLDSLDIERVRGVVGGSLGGQQALEMALAFPERVERAIVLAASPRLSTQGLAFNAVGRYAIMNDPHYRDGDYYDNAARPDVGLAVARMVAHITYLSATGMHEKFMRQLQAEEKKGSNAELLSKAESYLNYQGQSFVERFDANSYIYITRAMDHYDAARQWGGGNLEEACRRISAKIMVVSFSSDWLYPPADCREFASALCRVGKTVTYVNVPSNYGHDAFLVETEPVSHLLRHFLDGKERP